jgi:tetratricopeptide (TPR) repeat protein
MLTHSAEESFRNGLRALAEGRRKEALALFEAAIELERRFGTTGRPQARYLSYYGLCLGLEQSDVHEALRFCREAVTLEGYNADIRCNLGRVLLRAGRLREAHAALAKGQQIQPSHAGIRTALKKMGVRRPPVVPFLTRGHPLNRLLGRIRTGNRAA